MSRIMNVGDDARRFMATVKRLNSIAVCNAHGYANSNLHPTLKRSNTNSTLSESRWINWVRAPWAAPTAT